MKKDDDGGDGGDAAVTTSFFIPYDKFQNSSNSQQQQERHAEFLNFTARAMAYHQEWIQTHYSPAFAVNFWEHDHILNLNELSANIWNATQHLLSKDARQQFQLHAAAGGDGLENIKFNAYTN
jgi:hypothetical protein